MADPEGGSRVRMQGVGTPPFFWKLGHFHVRVKLTKKYDYVLAPPFHEEPRLAPIFFKVSGSAPEHTCKGFINRIKGKKTSRSFTWKIVFISLHEVDQSCTLFR